MSGDSGDQIRRAFAVRGRIYTEMHYLNLPTLVATVMAALACSLEVAGEHIRQALARGWLHPRWADPESLVIDWNTHLRLPDPPRGDPRWLIAEIDERRGVVLDNFNRTLPAVWRGLLVSNTTARPWLEWLRAEGGDRPGASENKPAAVRPISPPSGGTVDPAADQPQRSGARFSYRSSDMAKLPEMAKLMAGGMTKHGAALELAPRLGGKNTSLPSRARRLVRLHDQVASTEQAWVVPEPTKG